jgi:hypothetical protein
MVGGTLTKAWLFATPLTIEKLEPNKYLFTLSQHLSIPTLIALSNKPLGKFVASLLS